MATTDTRASSSSRSRSRRGRARLVPCVLAVGGLDPGGGAGVLTDARAIARAGAFGCAVVSVLTVQSTSGMRSARPTPKAWMIAACREVLKHQRVRAIKVGALGSEENARALGDLLAIHRGIPAVVDTVMLPTRGRSRLLEERGVAVLRARVLPRAALVTANAPEAEALTGSRVTRLDEAHDAAVALVRLGARAVLLKGGHLSGRHAVDLLAVATEGAERRGRAARASTTVIELSAPRLELSPTHGGGCALASLIAGRLAARADDAGRSRAAAAESSAVAEAVRWAKATHHEALSRAADAGGDLRVLFA